MTQRTSAEDWESDLLAAGWRRVKLHVYADPDGYLWRGPYGAWCELQRRKASLVVTCD